MSKTKKTTAPVSPLRVGEKVFIRTVTNYFTGRVVGLAPKEILLADAAWIAWTKRWANAIASAALEEIEPYPDGAIVLVNRETVVDICAWKHELPRAQTGRTA